MLILPGSLMSTPPPDEWQATPSLAWNTFIISVIVAAVTLAVLLALYAADTF
jgi:hypothetical protein